MSTEYILLIKLSMNGRIIRMYKIRINVSHIAFRLLFDIQMPGMDIQQITEQDLWQRDKQKIHEDEKVKESLSRAHKMPYSFRDENVLMTGSRQVGKTTFLKLYIKDQIDKGEDPKRMLYPRMNCFKDF